MPTMKFLNQKEEKEKEQSFTFVRLHPEPIHVPLTLLYDNSSFSNELFNMSSFSAYAHQGDTDSDRAMTGDLLKAPPASFG
jgi:hypothetical protein